MKRGLKLGALLHKLGENRSGTSAVEFALVAPVFIALLMGTVEIGHLFLVQAEMTSTTREAVRRIATDAMTEAETRAFIHEELAEVLPNSAPSDSGSPDKTASGSDSLVYVNESLALSTSVSPESGTSDGSSSTDGVTVNVTSTDLASGRTDLTVEVSVPVANATLLNLAELFANDLTLDVTATMVKE